MPHYRQSHAMRQIRTCHHQCRNAREETRHRHNSQNTKAKTPPANRHPKRHAIITYTTRHQKMPPHAKPGQKTTQPTRKRQPRTGHHVKDNARICHQHPKTRPTPPKTRAHVIATTSQRPHATTSQRPHATTRQRPHATTRQRPHTRQWRITRREARQRQMKDTTTPMPSK